MTSPRASTSDHRVLNLAKEVSETRERRMPAVLLQLRDILDSAPIGTPDGTRIRREIWEYNMLQMLIIVIQQDFSILPGEWKTAASLATLVGQVSCGLELVGLDRKQLCEEQLPKAIEHLFLLAKHIQRQLINTPVSQDAARSRSELMQNFREVLDAITYMCGNRYILCSEAMKSQWLLQLLISDDPKTVNMVMGMMEKVLRSDGTVLSKVKEDDVLNLMDELIYKLSVNNDISVASCATRCLLRFCEQHKPLVEVLFSRYRGLRPLLRRWEGRGFERDLRQLYTLLDSGSALKAQSQRKHDAASYIQARWKGFATRRRLRKADIAFAKFQRSYRLKKAAEEHELLTTRVQTELQRQMMAQRRKIRLKFKERQLQTLEILPAAQIEKFLTKEKSEAALKIQARWRGHRERTQLPRRQQVVQQVRAAIKIQRAVRRWLERIERRQQDVPTHLKPSGLTDERRVQLQEKINRRRQEQPTGRKTREEVEEIHKTASEMLARHYSRIRHVRKKQYNWENLLARLDTDSELLFLAPPLKDITQKDVEMYSSRSLPVATKAKSQHNVTLQRLQRPWWRQQWEEDDEVDEAERENYIAEMNLLL